LENGSHGRQSIVVIGWVKFPFGSASASRLRTFAQGLVENGVSVHLITTSRIQYGTEGCKKNGVFEWNGISYESTNVYDVTRERYSFLSRSVNLLLAIFRSWGRLHRLIVRGECTAVYIYGRSIVSYGPVALIARLAGVPVIFDICEWFPTSKYRLAGLDPYFIDDYLGRQLPRFLGDGVVAITSFIKKKYDGMKVQCILIPSLCDTNYCLNQGDTIKRSSVSEVFTLVYAGSCKPGDGFEDLLHAVKKVVAAGHPIRLHVVGTDGFTGWAARHRQTCEKDSLLRESVRFLGRVSDDEYPVVLQSADCLVLPRPDNQIVRAAFPTRLPEFLSSGRPVLTTNVPDVPRYLESGVHAEIVDGNDGDALAQGIVRLLKNPDRARKIGLAGQQRCREVFDYRPYIRILTEFVSTLTKKNIECRSSEYDNGQ
jgi:glycosyltransferase involved in cell wall biosynthesis